MTVPKRKYFDALRVRFMSFLVDGVIGLQEVWTMERQGLLLGDGGGVGQGGRGGGGGGGRGAIGTLIIECDRAEDNIRRYEDVSFNSRIAAVLANQNIL